jgi:cytosine/adenosine deaminase-related metal-dependent hydrolase
VYYRHFLIRSNYPCLQKHLLLYHLQLARLFALLPFHLKKYDVGIAHNMSANIKSAKGVSLAMKMQQQDLRIGLGTDTTMSGNTLSTIDEFNQVAKYIS